MPIRIRMVLHLLCGLFVLIQCSSNTREPHPEHVNDINRLPVIEPDYSNITLPPNIAPTNFSIREQGKSYIVHMASETGEAIHLSGSSPKIKVPPKAWKKLLSMNRGAVLSITILVQDENKKWHRFSPIKNIIANEDIDSHLVYRLLPPTHQSFNTMGIYQRDLQSFKERIIVYNKAIGNNCINCHSFHQYNPERMLFHMRAGKLGTAMMMTYDGEIFKIDTSTPFNKATSYRSWHPNGEIIAFAFNDVRQIFHAVGENRDVFDLASDLLLYNIKRRTITTSPLICREDRMETSPEWSPDGAYLYFGSAPGLESYDTAEHPYKQMRYDLMRIPYDAKNDTWGKVETILSVSELGKSVGHAKPSPDGRFILLCLSDAGYFPIYRPESDLYLFELETKILREIESINSDFADSYHSWSSNGRWIVFSSKRRDGLCTDPYFSYCEPNGNFSKPFILPQKDPERHNQLFRVYNVPEFVSGPINTRPQKIIKAVWKNETIKTNLDPRIEKKKSAESSDAMYRPFQ